MKKLFTAVVFFLSLAFMPRPAIYLGKNIPDLNLNERAGSI